MSEMNELTIFVLACIGFIYMVVSGLVNHLEEKARKERRRLFKENALKSYRKAQEIIRNQK